MSWLPTIDHILLLHQKMITCSGGSAGVRDRGLIESALARGQASFGEVELYPAIEQKAAAIGCGLTQITVLWMAISASVWLPCC